MLNKGKIFAFDIETVPDLHAAKRLLCLDEKTTNDEVYRLIVEYHEKIANGNQFLRQPFWQLACLSYVEAEITDTKDEKWYKTLNIKSAGDEKSTEEELILGFSKYCGKNTPRFVTFNGKTFDIPVLKYRAMFYDIAFDWFYKEEQISQYRSEKTYSDKWGDRYNLDLIDFYKPPSGGLKMAEVCSLFDIPAKINTDGSEVFTLFKDGKIAEIRNYCEEDAIATFILFLISEFHKGEISKSGYEKSLASLFENIAKIKHLEQFYSQAKTSIKFGKFIV
ncbi:3'-5' exonuclease [Candidatus Deianiraea vastatrix]|uniref:3'-5' exonuclease n=1 Tax=Candidatus Deianiraea vastatrix TaxID=2163644 RepID=A0A5B8XJR2_9RICK|nr:3'-5' exonuclease [Candidatus Deianiraea vastatrix]QED23777.1 Putative 3'-5' exonuclease [Candidatus Deianiraea vastatrix]